MALEGLRVGVTSHRKGSELEAALERRGAQVLLGPTVGGDVPVPVSRILADTDTIVDARPSWLVASTGVGMRLWAAAATEHGRIDALREVAAAARCVTRGAKATGGLQELHARPVWSSERQTDADVVGWLAGHVLPGDVVAVQLHGSALDATWQPLRDRGADVLSVATYRHALPEDVAPAEALVAAVLAGDLDVVTFTSPGAARNLIAIAEAGGAARREALVDAFRERVAAAVIGPVTASAVEALGMPVWVAPRRWRTGDLLRSLETWAATRATLPEARPQLQLSPETYAVSVPGGAHVPLGERGFAVLAALARRPGVVCPLDQLLSEAWGHAAPDDPSAIKHQVARLRRKLTGTGVTIVTVRGVGYRLDRVGSEVGGHR
ncbi:uroporphyrinogen-III synthase [Nitriliruptor alkaliphilus]|uniref:uroporphyrinogen-III synthase n=1 Tax=Nitriliruptor alkaliphilus TaxID=427918 RepID=UPI000695BFBF|nr:uroporphyrinogen-III synthase [Nitriliruptor alkaliphilus]